MNKNNELIKEINSNKEKKMSKKRSRMNLDLICKNSLKSFCKRMRRSLRDMVMKKLRSTI